MERAIGAVAAVALVVFAVGGCDEDAGKGAGDASELDVQYAEDTVDPAPCDGLVDDNPAACRQRSGCRVGCDECVPADEVSDAVNCGPDVDAAPDGAGGDAVDGSDDTSTGDVADGVGDVDAADGAGGTTDGGETGTDADGGVASWRKCGKSSDCVLVKDNCCGWCGTATLNDLDPVNRNRKQDHFNDVCQNPGGPCPACAQGPIPEEFEAHCAGSICREIDLSSSQNCTSNSHCRVRTLDCCEDCQADTSKEALVAINKVYDQQVKNALCPSPQPACARCTVNYPSTVKAVCNSNGRCTLQ